MIECRSSVKVELNYWGDEANKSNKEHVQWQHARDQLEGWFEKLVCSLASVHLNIVELKFEMWKSMAWRRSFRLFSELNEFDHCQ